MPSAPHLSDSRGRGHDQSWLRPFPQLRAEYLSTGQAGQEVKREGREVEAVAWQRKEGGSVATPPNLVRPLGSGGGTRTSTWLSICFAFGPRPQRPLNCGPSPASPRISGSSLAEVRPCELRLPFTFTTFPGGPASSGSHGNRVRARWAGSASSALDAASGLELPRSSAQAGGLELQDCKYFWRCRSRAVAIVLSQGLTRRGRAGGLFPDPIFV